jgi:Flp pilus assembly protein TadD
VSSPSRVSVRGWWWHACVIAVASIVTYWNGRHGPFISDDLVSISGSSQIHKLWDIGVVFPERDTSFAGRPLVNISFAINYALGGLDVRGYHVVNILVHAVCALFVYTLVRRTLQLPSLAGRFGTSAGRLAFASALIFAVHPLNSETVDYLSQRTESMMALFFLLTIYCAVRAVDASRRAVWSTLAVASSALGMACKESMATVPVILALYDRVYVFESWRDALRARWRLYAGLAATWLVLVALLSTNPRGETSGFAAAVTPWTYLLNQTVILTQYFRLVLWPRSLAAEYGWTLPLSLGDVWLHAVLVVALLMLVGVALLKWPRVGFAGAWVFITLAPTSSIVPIANEVGRECRMYLPMVALSALAVVGVAAAWQGAAPDRLRTSPRAPLIGMSAAFVIVAVLAAETIVRNRDYRSALALYRTMVDRWPTSRTRHILASALQAEGRRAEAMEQLRLAADAVPWARYDLGLALFEEGRLDEAVEHLQKVIDIWTSPPRSHPHWQRPLRVHAWVSRRTIGKARALQGRWAEASEQFRLTLALAPREPETMTLLAEALVKQKLFDEAVAAYREYLALRPNDAVALTNFGFALLNIDKLDEAVVMFRRAAELKPAIAELNLANALFDSGKMDEALVHARKAVSVTPNDPGAHDVLGRTLAVHGQFAEAITAFEDALRLDPGHADARAHLARVRSVFRR